MYKIIDLGSTFEPTGEARVRIMDGSLIKTASSVMQEYWDGLVHDDEAVYLWVIGVSAYEYYGCNNNGDAFTEADLKRTHTDFVEKAHVFLHHVNKDPAKSVGKPIFSWYNDEMHRVELILKVNRNAPGAEMVLLKLELGQQLYVSMGCSVAADKCSICGHMAKTRAEYCDHLRFNMKKILEDGRQVFAFNPDPHFFDISIVNKPADPTAYALDKIASMYPQQFGFGTEKTSAELGEEVEDRAEKIAALQKLSDIIKEVDGEVIDSKGSVAHRLSEEGFDDMDYPEMDYDKLDRADISPAAFLQQLREHEAPLTLSDAMWLAHKHMRSHMPFSYDRASIMGMLPKAIEMLMGNPEVLDDICNDICGDYGGDFSSPRKMRIIISVTTPVMHIRKTHIGMLSPRGWLEKTSAEIGSITDGVKSLFTGSGSNFQQVQTSKGVTSAYHVRQVARQDFVGRVLGMSLAAAGIVGASVAATPLGKAVSLAAAGIPAAAILNSTRHDRFEHTNVGHSMPYDYVRQVWKKHPMHKEAALVSGMAVPEALALDYAYNKWLVSNS